MALDKSFNFIRLQLLTCNLGKIRIYLSVDRRVDEMVPGELTYGVLIC